jgi:PAS domain S-box-containing protein
LAVGFRGKQIATLTLVAATVALATSVVNLSGLARLSVDETRSRAELLAETLYHQASRVIRQHGRDGIEEALSQDPSLASYAEGVVGYSPTIMYVVITGATDIALVHSTPTARGEPVPPAPSLAAFAEENPLEQLWALAKGHQVLEVSVPFEVDGKPFGSVRVAISTLLLREEVAGAVVRNVLLATGAVLAAFIASFALANRLLAPIEMLRRELGRIDPGEGEPPLDLRNEADVSRVAEFFASVSRKLADGKHREGESGWLSTMLGGLSDAVVVVNPHGNVLSLNRPAEKLLAKRRDELEGKSIEELVPRDHPVARVVHRALSRGESIGPTNVRIEDSERRTVYALSAQVLRDASGISGVMVSARDMDKLSRLGSHLSYSQKLAALGKLTSGVAHEIKNPLNAMVIHVALLREKLSRAGPSDAQASLDTLEQEIRRLDRVISGFLKFTRPEDLQLTSVTLPELLEEVVQLVSVEAEGSGIAIEADVSSAVPPVYGDRELLQQVFVNLMRNAIEAMPGGGQLHLSARPVEESIEIVVSDTGVGIDPELLDKIFDLYVTTKSRGSGIGLSVVYRIVQLHGGEITVESRKGEGARFLVRLPQVPG